MMWANNKEVLHKTIAVSALGKNMKNGFITDIAINNLKNILENYIDIAYRFCDRIVILATSASREAKNISIIKEWLENKYGLKYNVISEETEAKLNGIANIRDFKSNKSKMLFDIGGGSTEITCIENNKIIKVFSLKLGLRRIINVCGYDINKQTKYINNVLCKYKFLKFDECIGIGGTVCSLATLNKKLEHYDSNLVHKSKISIDDIENVQKKFIEENDKIPFEFISKNAFLCGVNTVKTFMKFLNINSFYVSDKSIQHGFLNLDIAEKIKYL